jgi:hypothetical protein
MKYLDLYKDKLNWFKDNEKPEALLVIVDKPDRIKTIIAWLNISPGLSHKVSKFKGKSESEIWTWLWDNTEYSRDEMIDKLGIPLSVAGLESILRPLIGNRVIYPDGTINSYVQKYLREQVVELFKGRR